MADPKQIVGAGYDVVAAEYAALEEAGAEWPRLRRLEELLARLAPGGHVLDVGCGNGIPALAAIAERHLATGVDISAVQVEAARRNVPAAHVLQGDIAECDFPAGQFAAIVAFYVLDHLPREEHGPLLARFSRWLEPGGHLLFTTEPGDDPGTVGEWLDVPMYFSQFDERTTTALLEGAGLEPIGLEREAQLEGGREVDFVWFYARKRP